MAAVADVELERRKRLKNDFPFYARTSLKIRTKQDGIQPLILNKAQQHIHDCLEEQIEITGKVRAVILKGRQEGASTYIEARYMHKTTHRKGVSAFILTHDDKATQNLFKMAKRYHTNLPPQIRPQLSASNANELSFGAMDSGYSVGTAGSKSVGRSSTNQFFHGCLSADSLVITPDGNSLRMDEIEPGDSVVTSSGACAKVKNKIYTGKKQTYEFECWATGEPIYLTSNHKVLTEDGYKEVQDITLDDYVAMPDMRGDGSKERYDFTLKNKERPQNGGSKHIENHSFELTEEFGYFLGYYLAEGHVKDNLGYITFTYHKDETFIDYALTGVIGIPTSVSSKTEGNRGRTMVYGKFLASAVNEMCGRVSGKGIPSWVFECREEFREGVLRGYLDGDGSKTAKDKISAPSIHERIARQVQRLWWSLYGACSVSKHERSRYGVETSDIYLTRVSGNTMRAYRGEGKGKRREKSKVVDGVVYCKVKDIHARKIEDVWDIEVDHPDHNYQTSCGVVSNSEVAFWANASEHAKGIMQTIPEAPGTEIIYESTANGMGNFFHQQWKMAEAGISEFIAIFVPWFWMDEYRKELPEDFALGDDEQAIKYQYSLDDEQMYWRRMKIIDLSDNGQNGLKAFRQEYPNNAAEAFQVSGGDGLITSDAVMRARKVKAKPSGPLIVGVDPSRGGDRFSTIKRAGRKAYGKQNYVGDQVDKLGKQVAICKDILDTECPVAKKKPDMMFIDAGGGIDIVDRLHELGYENVKAIYFGATPFDTKKYKNKRGEMWGLMNEWLNDEHEDVEIPDDDEMQADLCASPYDRDSHDRYVLWKKERILAKYGFSPDDGDALALTFAEPIKMVKSKKIKYQGWS